MRMKGKNLEFLCLIKRDGSGTEVIPNDSIKSLERNEFSLIRLSLVHDTWIASEFNCYVVKIKN